MLIDSHCHIIDPRLKKDIPQLLSESRESGATKLISIGTSLSNSSDTYLRIKEYPEIYSSVGVYPHEDKEIPEKDIFKGLDELIKNDNEGKIVAVGECGLDISDYENPRSLEEQEKIFIAQIELSIKHDLPLVIHNRNSDDRVFSILEGYKNNIKGIAHCFTSAWESAVKYLDLGFYISFSGIITYPSRNDLREVLRNIPEDRILFETDSPHLPPQGHRGEINYPKYVRIVAETASQIIKKPFLEVCRISYENTCRIFNI